ncbi:MAG: hypothetical protein VW239_04765 [Candidatus Nanopelagicales bacterium]
MPPGVEPIPVRVLENLAAALALPDGGADYYHAVTFGGIGRDITAPALSGYPAVFIGEPGEVGQYSEVAEDSRTLWHGTWYWDIPVFGVIRDVGGGDAAYKSLLRLAADIYRAVMVDYSRGGLATRTELRGWTILGPQEQTDGRPWVGTLVRVVFKTRDQEMVTGP